MKFLKRALLGIALLGLSTTASAQMDFSSITAGTATLTPEKCISIDVTEPVQEYYVFDITPLGFASEEEAAQYCNTDLSNLLTVYLDYPNTQVYLQLHTDRLTETKTVEWWSNYIGGYCFH